MDTFTYLPSYDSAIELAPRLVSIKLGDGYEQSFPDGINIYKKVWDLPFDVVEPTEATAIVTFFKDHATEMGFEPFIWEDLDGDTLNYVCKRWRRVFTAFGHHQITATFEQWFG